MSGRRRLQPKIEINMTPLVDVILQLIIFFMITTSFRTAPGISMDLPTSVTAQNVKTSELRVTVMSESEIYIDKTLTDLKNLPAVLKARVGGSGGAEGMRAVLEGRSGAPYQTIISVLDAFRENGIENVGLITRKSKDMQ